MSRRAPIVALLLLALVTALLPMWSSAQDAAGTQVEAAAAADPGTRAQQIRALRATLHGIEAAGPSLEHAELALGQAGAREAAGDQRGTARALEIADAAIALARAQIARHEARLVRDEAARRKQFAERRAEAAAQALEAVQRTTEPAPQPDRADTGTEAGAAE